MCLICLCGCGTVHVTLAFVTLWLCDCHCVHVTLCTWQCVVCGVTVSMSKTVSVCVCVFTQKQLVSWFQTVTLGNGVLHSSFNPQEEQWCKQLGPVPRMAWEWGYTQLGINSGLNFKVLEQIPCSLHSTAVYQFSIEFWKLPHSFVQASLNTAVWHDKLLWLWLENRSGCLHTWHRSSKNWRILIPCGICSVIFTHAWAKGVASTKLEAFQELAWAVLNHGTNSDCLQGALIRNANVAIINNVTMVIQSEWDSHFHQWITSRNYMLIYRNTHQYILSGWQIHRE